MRTRTCIACLLSALAAAAAWATDQPESRLEELLRAQRPDIVRWQVQAIERKSGAAVPESDIAFVGRIGARTAVRSADGRVRWYAVQGFRPVLVSAHAIASGAPIGAADATLAESEVIASACDPASLDAATRWRATRALAAGEPLCVHAVAPAPDVERAATVTLFSERGGISVSRELVAAADAQTGERVRLRDPASGATIVAIVTGAGRARVTQE